MAFNKAIYRAGMKIAHLMVPAWDEAFARLRNLDPILARSQEVRDVPGWAAPVP